MHPLPPILTDFQLQPFNTFGIAARARAYARIDSAQALAALLADARYRSVPRLVLGGGSNLVLAGDVDALVLHMCQQGMQVVGQTGDATLVRAHAGQGWHALVQWTLAQGLGGLENLSLIPGSVGAAPIQNIGAYGAELKDVLHSVTVFDPERGATRSLARAECRFGYRDSIFKHAEGAQAIVLDVTLALPRAWQPNLRYGELAQALATTPAPSAQQVSDAVVAIRRAKLPDPQELGNAGSYFKNPVVSREQCAALLAAHPGLVHYAQPDGSAKLAAGWLIDQCGWKGRRVGAAGVYPKQALVLVNYGGASGREIVALAEAIAADVFKRYGVALETEPVRVGM